MMAFQKRLNEVGYVEGQNVTIDNRWGESQLVIGCQHSRLI